MSGLRGLLIPADATKPCQIVAIPDDTAAACAAAIGCQWIERVTHPWLSDRHLVMLVDEEGLLTGQPHNPRAQRFYGGSTPIVGDALILGERLDGEGEIVFAPLHPFQVGQLVGLGFLDSVPAGEGARP